MHVVNLSDSQVSLVPKPMTLALDQIIIAM